MTNISIFLKDLRFRRALFSKHKTYLYFKFNVDGSWRRGKVEYPFRGYDASVANTTRLISTFVYDKLTKNKVWSDSELRDLSSVLDQLVKTPDGATSKIIYP